MGVSINALSRDVNVPPNRISEIVNGKRSTIADTALHLASISAHPRKSGSICKPITTSAWHMRTVWPQIEPLVRTHKKVLAQVPISQ